jgi:hypothetical protein
MFESEDKKESRIYSRTGRALGFAAAITGCR